MNQIYCHRVGIAACSLLISLVIIFLGEVSDCSGPGFIDSSTASLSDSLSENPFPHPSAGQMDILHNASLMEDLHELNSSEILLLNQSHQIDLNDTISLEDSQSIEQSSIPLSTYERILRERAIRLAKFELKVKEIWPKLCPEERVEITRHLEELLRRQAILIHDFQYQLKKKFCLYSIQDKKKFLDSFQDLLDRQAHLLMGFEDLLHQLQNVPEENMIQFLGSFEDLIRKQAILLDIYDDFLKVECNKIKVNKYIEEQECYRSGQVVNYTYVIKNTCNCSTKEIDIVDSRLGAIVKGISLGPYETKSVNKTIILDYQPGTRVCNTAWAIDPDDFTIGSSNEICIRMCPSGKNETYGLPEPVQYGQYCESQKVAGTGIVDVSTSIVDKNIALQYQNSLAGNGDIELDSENALSESASRLQRPMDNNTTPLNLYEDTRLTYSGETPLSGGKYLESREFFGGIGASINEAFSVSEMEKDQKTFFASTDPASNEVDLNKSNQLRNASSTHLVAIKTKNSFNGTWETDSRLHKILYKDIKAHELFNGTFEAEKTIKFHENPVPEKKHSGCEGIDC